MGGFVKSIEKTESEVGIDLREVQAFPTLIYNCRLDNPSNINRKLRDLIYQLRAQDVDGIKRSNLPEFGGWHSQTNIHALAGFQDLLTLIIVASGYVSEKLQYSSEHEISCTAMWANINKKRSFNQRHSHPGALWSGVYYVQVPNASGEISFFDPREVNVASNALFNLNEAPRPRATWTSISFTPIAGQLLLFPSWLHHWVSPNFTELDGEESDLISVSFNLNQISSSG